MNLIRFSILIYAVGSLHATDQLTGFPFQSETLRYNIKLTGGATLGEVTVGAAKGEAASWHFDMSFKAGLPGVPFADTYRANSAPGLCSTELVREIVHGPKKVTEKTTFDQKRNVAERQTLNPAGGGKSELQLPTCARDALAYYFYARQEMGQGRVPQAAKVFFGNGYDIRMDYTGAMNIPFNGKTEVTDHVNVYIKGPASDLTVEIFYARDPARTPLLIKVPVPIGKVSLELVK
jgi:hypothetical protein